MGGSRRATASPGRDERLGGMGRHFGAPHLLLARGVRRELLDVARDGADVFLADQALPRSHAGAAPPGLDASNELRLAPLEPLQIRGGRGSLAIGAPAVPSLPE